MEFSEWILPVAAATLHGFAYLIYNVDAEKKTTDPNLFSWFIWSFTAVLNALTFKDMNQNWLSALQFFTGSAASILTFFLTLRRVKMSWPNKFELGSLLLAVTAGFLWAKWHQAGWANMLLLLALLLGFVPTYRGMKEKPSRERPRAWFMWTGAFLITLLNVVVQGYKWTSCIMPLFGAVLHASVGVLTYRKVRESS